MRLCLAAIALTGKGRRWRGLKGVFNFMAYHWVFDHQIVKIYENNAIVIDYASGKAHSVTFSPVEHKATDMTVRKTVKGEGQFWMEDCLKKLFGRINYEKHTMTKCFPNWCLGYTDSPVSVAAGSGGVIVENKLLSSPKRFIRVPLKSLIFDMRGLKLVDEAPDPVWLWFGFCYKGRHRDLYVWVNQEMCMSTEVILKRDHALFDRKTVGYEDFRRVAL